MGRKSRLFVENIAQHLCIKGINQKEIFKDEKDFSYYLELLKNISKEMFIQIHAFTLLPSQINILATFNEEKDPSRFMQGLGLKYVSYFNKKYSRKGTIWEGRYKSSLVEDTHILAVMNYIEYLPILKNICRNFESYSFSSYLQHFKSRDSFLSEHFSYGYLGQNNEDKVTRYRTLFYQFIENHELQIEIESILEKQLPTGSEEFLKVLENELGHSVIPKKRGRPKKSKNKPKRKEMYTKLVVLDKEKHKSLKLSPLKDLNFAKEMAFVPLLANEMGMVTDTFPVVFTSDKNPSLVTLTSIGQRNLAINEEGKYISRYVPAFLRKYPFALANKGKGSKEKIVLVDEEASIISKTKGKQLFTKDGEESETLKNTIKFLSEYEKQLVNTQFIVKSICDAEILEPREISIGEGDEKKVLVKGFQVVNKEKMNQLSDETLALWVRKGIITFIDFHLKSLNKIELLFKLANQVQK